jgi:hypothetical protein
MTYNAATYMLNRFKYDRPQAVIWSNNDGTLIEIDDPNNPDNKIKVYAPEDLEVGYDSSSITDDASLDQFLILTDHNRSPINVSPIRIEKRERTINGKMRSYHIADKLSFDISWKDLPSRAFSTKSNFQEDGSPSVVTDKSQYIVDGGAGGVELLRWYETHPGPFWMFLAYDKYSQFEGASSTQYQNMGYYNQLVQVYIADFQYTISKRGKLYDFWDVSVKLEEC